MAERYSRLFSLPENLYIQTSPVIIAAGALLKDNQTGKVLAQLKIQNIGPKTIKALTVSVSAFDAGARPIGEAITHQYLDLDAKRDCDFGTKEPIALSDNSTRSFNVVVTEVIFSDGEIQTISDTTWVPLEKQPNLQDVFVNPELVKQFNINTVTTGTLSPTEYKDLWYCSCGAINRTEETVCHACHKNKANLFEAMDRDSLQKALDARLAEEAIQAEAMRKEAEKAAELQKIKAHKIKKALAIALIFIVVCIAVFMLLTKVIIPNNHYKQAVELMDAGDYSAAIIAFEEMNGYKDSSDKIDECNYLTAVQLMDDGEYNEAIEIFKALDGYKDAQDQIDACNSTLTQIAYDAAIELMEAENYVTAAAKFADLDGYSDSQTMIDECNYQLALEAIDEEDYASAWDILLGIPDYKDAADYISHYYCLPYQVTTRSSTADEDTVYTFSYDKNGIMISADRTSYAKTDSYCFDENGILLSEVNRYSTTTPYKTDENGIVIKYREDGITPSFRYDQYGNVIAYYLDSENTWREYTNLSFDSHHNRNNSTETNEYAEYDGIAEPFLAAVYYQKNNLIKTALFEYILWYVEERNVDTDLIWKNVRIICGQQVWY